MLVRVEKERERSSARSEDTTDSVALEKKIARERYEGCVEFLDWNGKGQRSELSAGMSTAKWMVTDDGLDVFSGGHHDMMRREIPSNVPFRFDKDTTHKRE